MSAELEFELLLDLKASMLKPVNLEVLVVAGGVSLPEGAVEGFMGAEEAGDCEDTSGLLLRSLTGSRTALSSTYTPYLPSKSC